MKVKEDKAMAKTSNKFSKCLITSKKSEQVVEASVELAKFLKLKTNKISLSFPFNKKMMRIQTINH